MKKFLFALMGLVIAGNAFGDECGCITNWPNMTDNIVVTFATGSSTPCGCAKDEIEKFLAKYKDIKQVQLIGSASQSGGASYNQNLSLQRMQQVKEVLPKNITVVGWNEGESNAWRRFKELSLPTQNEQQDRSVTIIPVQEHVDVICEESTIKQVISTFPTEAKPLSDACMSGLDNSQIVKILADLIAKQPTIVETFPAIQNTQKVYQLYAELLKETEDIRRRVSVWRTAEGKFNTARLLSDSIAGVVLGTVGGVVTSNLIKKSQVKHGFEDIKCSIGGQSVASYGDEFSVGLVH